MFHVVIQTNEFYSIIMKTGYQRARFEHSINYSYDVIYALNISIR